jgi:hypothetical protein
MTLPSPRIYIYKITFEEVPYYYYGVHKEKKFGEYYMGSPYTHKWCWELYTSKKQILQFFDFTDEGWIEAQKVEERLIKPVFNTDKWCLNENCGGKISLNVRRETGKKVGKKIYEEKKGIHSLSFEERSEMGKKAGKICYEECKGIHAETTEQRRKRGQKLYREKKGIHTQTFKERSELGKRNGQKLYEEGKGIFGMSLEEKSEISRKTGKNHYENKTGIFSIAPEERKEINKKTNKKLLEESKGIFSLTNEERIELGKKTTSQVWKCTITGHTSTPGGLSNFQKKRSIDTSKRVRVS